MTSIADQTGVNQHSEPFLGESDGFILADVELCRLALVLYLTNLLRLWLIARDISQQKHGGSGWISKTDLLESFTRTGETMTTRHFRRLIKRGNGTFWTENGDRLYLAGIVAVATELCILAGLRGLGAAIQTNQPGGLKSAWLNITGTHEQFEANIYAAWLGSLRDTTISRAILEALFNRDQTTLRRWEQTRLRGIVQVTPGYAITTDPDRLPSDGVGFNERSQEFIWQLPNTYRVTVRQTPHNGQRRRVKRAVSGPYLGDGAERTRLYFDTLKRLNRAVSRFPEKGQRYAFVGRWRGNNFFSPGQRTRMHDSKA